MGGADGWGVLICVFCSMVACVRVTVLGVLCKYSGLVCPGGGGSAYRFTIHISWLSSIVLLRRLCFLLDLLLHITTTQRQTIVEAAGAA